MPISEENMVLVLFREQLSLLAYIRMIVADRDVAEDVFQEVSVEAIHHRNRIETEDHLVSFLRQTARHRALNAVRDRRMQISTLAPDVIELLANEWEDSSVGNRQEALTALHHCMDLLTPFSQRLVNLRYVEGLSCMKLAEIVGRSHNSVYMALSRIRRSLANCVRQKLQEEEVAR